jgi:hypothetical protein
MRPANRAENPRLLPLVFMTGASIRDAFSVICASTCWSATTFIAVAVASARRWEFIATGATERMPTSSVQVQNSATQMRTLKLTILGESGA